MLNTRLVVCFCFSFSFRARFGFASSPLFGLWFDLVSSTFCCDSCRRIGLIELFDKLVVDVSLVLFDDSVRAI